MKLKNMTPLGLLIILATSSPYAFADEMIGPVQVQNANQHAEQAQRHQDSLVRPNHIGHNNDHDKKHGSRDHSQKKQKRFKHATQLH
jgi:Skp family chaperone for outer membrane proteins